MSVAAAQKRTPKKDIKSLCRAYTDSAVKRIVAIMGAESTPAATSLAAAQYLIDRGWGKAAQQVDVSGDTKLVIEIRDPTKALQDNNNQPMIDVTPEPEDN